jgi:hypothetical protein
MLRRPMITSSNSISSPFDRASPHLISINEDASAYRKMKAVECEETHDAEIGSGAYS